MRISDRVRSSCRLATARSGRGVAGSVVLLLAACSAPNAPADTNTLAQAETAQGQAAADDGRILCARGSATLARTCTVEVAQDNGTREGGSTLTVRNAEGGFHRLRITRDGRGVVAADGAEPARVTIVGSGEIEVAIGDARYRLPATVKAGNGGG